VGRFTTLILALSVWRLVHCQDDVKLRQEGIFAVGNLHDQLGAK
jgi:hypothetical protein